MPEPQLLEGLLRRIKELQTREGFGDYGWRFRLMARVLGYCGAERAAGLGDPRVEHSTARKRWIRPPGGSDIVSSAAPRGVSVIIPAYRAAHTIGRAIDSLLTQTRPPHEILVIDDGSPDDLPAALAPYGERVRLHPPGQRRRGQRP